jgi:hypothetical protein
VHALHLDLADLKSVEAFAGAQVCHGSFTAFTFTRVSGGVLLLNLALFVQCMRCTRCTWTLQVLTQWRPSQVSNKAFTRVVLFFCCCCSWYFSITLVLQVTACEELLSVVSVVIGNVDVDAGDAMHMVWPVTW